jgi:hypothetical protein
MDKIDYELLSPTSNFLLEYQSLEDSLEVPKVLDTILSHCNTNPKLAFEAVALSLKWKTRNYQSISYMDFQKWFSVLWNGHEQNNPSVLGSVLNSFVSNTTFETYSVLLELHLNHLSSVSVDDVNLGCLHSIKFLLHNCVSAWKPNLVSKISQLSSCLSQICRSTSSGNYVLICLDIGIYLAQTTSIQIKASQLSVLFDVISQIEMNRNLRLNVYQQEQLYEMLFMLLNTIIRYRREEMLNLIPIFLLHVSSMIDCFTVPDPRKIIDKQFIANPIVPLKGVIPDQRHAKMISRVLFQMTQKPLSGDTKKLEMIKPFSKHVPFLVFKLLFLQISTRRNLKEEWKLSMYACLDACDEHGRNMILAGLENNLQSLRPIYKAVVSDWEKEHRYHGKA